MDDFVIKQQRIKALKAKEESNTEQLRNNENWVWMLKDKTYKQVNKKNVEKRLSEGYVIINKAEF